METFNYIKKRCSSLESSRQTWEDHWQSILDYVMPRKADVTFVRSKGEKRTERRGDAWIKVRTGRWHLQNSCGIDCLKHKKIIVDIQLQGLSQYG